MIGYNKLTLREMFDGKPVSPVLPYMSLDADREIAEIVAKGNGRISLSGVQPKYSMVVDNGPAYDLMNTSLHLAMPSIFALKKGLFKEGMMIDDTHHVDRRSFLVFGERIGLPEKLVTKELDRMAKTYPLAEELIMESLLSDRLKHAYLSSYNYRRFTLSE